jgi:hypothetical protein
MENGHAGYGQGDTEEQQMKAADKAGHRVRLKLQ